MADSRRWGGQQARWRHAPPTVVRGVVVPRYTFRKPFLSVYVGEHGQFMTQASSESRRVQQENTIFGKHGARPIYRINLS